jgi:hypothetical protein
MDDLAAASVPAGISSSVDRCSFDPTTLHIQSSWKPEAILIDNIEGKPKINIMDCLIDPNSDDDCHINLPSQRYPTNKEGRKTLQDEIRRAAVTQAQTELFIKNVKNKGATV